MTGEQLRDELARIAEAAPPVEVPDDLFARGRRATVRTRVLMTAAAVACIGLIAAFGAPLVLPDEVQVADDDAPGGVPDVIYAAPDGDVSDLPRTALDDLGPVVAAYQVGATFRGRLVVVTEDATYRTVRLPGYGDPAFDDVRPALSPDGTQLAYPTERSGIRGLAIVDLTSGSVRDVTLAAPFGAALRSLQWSPDGSWVAWSGQEVKALKSNRASYRLGVIAGLIGPESSHSRLLPATSGDDWSGVGICNDGTALTFLWPTFSVYDGGDPALVRSWARATTNHGACAAPRIYAQLDGSDDEQLVGWIEGGEEPTAVALRPNRDDRQDSMALVLVDHDGHARTVGTAEAGVTNLTVATGLMSTDRPTVPAGESPWDRPWIVEHWQALLAFLAIAGVTILIVVRARAVRR